MARSNPSDTASNPGSRIEPIGEEAIAHAALKIGEPGRRAEYLDRAVGGDVGLRARVVERIRLLEGENLPPESPAPSVSDTMPLTQVNAPPEHPGGWIGPYRLIDTIGEGGMGTVYLAEQERPVRRRVALKAIKPGMDTRQVIARFEAERQALAMMDHPNIARVFDAGATANGRPYFAMELVRGIPITDYCDRACLPISGRVELFIRVCRAVQHAHQKGIIHRDIKPSNVLVADHDGTPVPKVIDFGVAKATGAACSLTNLTLQTGIAQLVGTPLYMSPEQAVPLGLDVDTRTDIYALGVVLYELLTGTTPFDAGRLRSASPDGLRRILREEEPPRPSTRLNALGDDLKPIAECRSLEPTAMGRAIRGELDWIVMKAMEKERQRRYDSAGALADDARRYLDGLPVEAGPPSPWYRFRKYARRNQALLIPSALLAGALLIGSGVSGWQAIRATVAERRALAALKEAERNARINRRFWYGSQIRTAQRELADRHVEFAQEALERLRPDPGEPDLRGFEWGYLHGLACRDFSMLFGHEAPVYASACSPDGRLLASGDRDGHVLIWDIRSRREIGHLPVQAGSVAGIGYSPDGRRIAVNYTAGAPTSSTLRLYDAATLRPIGRPLEFARHVLYMAFSADSRTLAACEVKNIDGVLHRTTFWAASDEGLAPLAPPPPGGEPRCFAASPDRRLFATSSADGRVTLRDASDARPIRALDAAYEAVQDLGFTPDGRSLIVQHGDGLDFLDPGTGGLQGRVPNEATDRPLHLSPDTQGLRNPPIAGDGSYRLFDFAPRPRARTLEGIRGDDQILFRSSADGRWLAGGGVLGRAFLWDARTGRKRGEFGADVRYVHALEFIDGGGSLITGDVESLRIWRLDQPPSPPDELAGHDGEVWDALFTPDGKQLITSGDDHAIRIWDPDSGEQVATLLGHGTLVTSLAISGDGRTLASGGFDKMVRLWDLETRQPLAVLGGHTGDIHRIALSADGRTLASAGKDGTIRTWDVAERREIDAFPGVGVVVHALAFHPDGRLVSADNHGTLTVRDLRLAGKPPRIPGRSPVLDIAFSPDGSTLAVADERGYLAIYDTDSWRRRLYMKGSHAPIFGIRFSPDGRTLAAACGDAKVRLWDPATGQLTLLLEGHAQRVNTVAFRFDSALLASGSHDGKIRLWHAEMEPLP